ncbi:hypothetical protein [Desulfobulbus sp.]|uniref:hypothetical protein n=1 Tax=Desulfobulbus sp. TaxID=895 RepID=UPI0027BAF661|nr:hypothetical protein [Desulfobulbus sp.]
MTKDTSSNQDKAWNPDQIVQQAEAIVQGLIGLHKNDAVAILSAGIYIIASGHNPPEDVIDHSCLGFNSNLIRRRRGGISTINKDQEIKAYILGIDRYLSLKEWHEELVKKFGKNRAPSKSAIGRFLQGMKRQSVSQDSSL